MVMEGIGVLIFLVFIILRALSKLPNIRVKFPGPIFPRQKLPRGWEKKFPPIIWERDFPWDDLFGSGRRKESPLPKDDTISGGEEKFEPEQPAPVWALSQTPAESPEKVELRVSVPESPPVYDSETESNQALLDNHTVLNGIIWSEILSPPKSKRFLSRHG